MSLVEFRHWCHLGGETISKLLNSKREFKWWGDPAFLGRNIADGDVLEFEHKSWSLFS